MASTGQEWKSASWKEEEDHSKETAEILEKINATTIPVLLRASNRSLEDIISELMAMEKRARLGNDTLSTQKLAVEVIKILRGQKKFDEMLEQLESLMKRRNQMKQVQSAMITEASQVVDDESLPKDKRNEVLTKLTNVTEGKIHVELEHARFSVQLADIAEAEGRLKEAADTLVALQVETITNMPRLEKLGVLIHQLELALRIEDQHLVRVTSRKINYRALGKEDTRDLKLKYFNLIRQYYERQQEYLVTARCWHELYLTETNEDKQLEALANAVVLVMIAPHQSVKSVEDAAECTAFSPKSMQTSRADWLKDLEKNKRVEEELATLFELVREFNTVDLIRTKNIENADTIAKRHPMLASYPERQNEFGSRFSEHDLLVVAQYYSRIKIEDLAGLVGLTAERVEGFIMELVQTNTLYAKIDRIDGLVVFRRRQNPAEVAAEWDKGVQKMVGLIEKTSHLVAKERMLLSTK